MLDTFGSAGDWPNDEAWAQRICKILVDQQYLWFEEPLSPNNIRGHQDLSASEDIRISGGEFFTEPSRFTQWAKTGVVDILQPDCTIAGGL
jgi:L-alanine-DL-glutamate epimerase-like enolase superfamily enzyme